MSVCVGAAVVIIIQWWTTAKKMNVAENMNPLCSVTASVQSLPPLCRNPIPATLLVRRGTILIIVVCQNMDGMSSINMSSIFIEEKLYRYNDLYRLIAQPQIVDTLTLCQ